MLLPRIHIESAIPLLLLTTAASGQNLLTNPGFEQGLTGWTTVSSTAESSSYGATGSPAVSVANHIGGGNKLARDLGGFAQLEQDVLTSPIGSGMYLETSGYFGGFSTFADSAQLFVEFWDGSGFELAQRSLPSVSRTERNDEDVLIYRRDRFAVPVGTERIVARIEFVDPCCQGTFGAADEIFLELTPDAPNPAPKPLDTQLVINGDFEGGFGPGSPLTLIDEQSWIGDGGTCLVKTYSNVDPNVPSTTIASILGGGSNLLTDVSGAGGLRQTIDVRGNAAQIASGLDLELLADLGGAGSLQDTSTVQANFLDSNFNPIGSQVPPLGPVTRAMRNGETTLLRRKDTYSVPAGTSYIRLSVIFADPCCSGTVAQLDNVEAYLRVPQGPVPQPLGVNILVNGSLEEGSVAGSPLVIDNPGTWVGINDNLILVPFYGSAANVPTASFAASNSLGGLLLAHSGTAGLTQSKDLRGLADLVDQGALRVETRAWLGGTTNSNDTAEFTLRFFNEFDAPLGLPRELGPVTAADRMNLTTLLERSDSFIAPAGARSLTVTVSFLDPCCSGSGALADGFEVVLSDNQAVGLPYCSTNPHSGGQTAQLRATGSPDVADNNLTLIAENMPPNQFGFFVTSLTEAFIQNPAGSQGNLCLGGDIGRYNQTIQFSGPQGTFFQSLDLPNTPFANGFTPVLAGETRSFQAWFRDVNPGPASNFTQGLRVQFL